MLPMRYQRPITVGSIGNMLSGPTLGNGSSHGNALIAVADRQGTNASAKAVHPKNPTNALA
jgi:hypothetical protein